MSDVNEEEYLYLVAALAGFSNKYYEGVTLYPRYYVMHETIKEAIIEYFSYHSFVNGNMEVFIAKLHKSEVNQSQVIIKEKHIIPKDFIEKYRCLT